MLYMLVACAGYAICLCWLRCLVMLATLTYSLYMLAAYACYAVHDG
jgi:hypothetical protein